MKMLAQITELGLCAFMSLHPCTVCPCVLAPNVPAPFLRPVPLCLHPYIVDRQAGINIQFHTSVKNSDEENRDGV